MYDLVNPMVLKQTSGSFVSTLQIAHIDGVTIHGHRDYDILLRSGHTHRTDGFTAQAYSRLLSCGVTFTYA